VSSEPSIREIDVDRDAEGVVALFRESEPQWVVTPESWRYDLEHFPPHAEYRGWVAVANDEVVGVAAALRHAWTTEPDVAHVRASVRSGYRGRGIGSRLYALAEEHAVGLGAHRLLCWLNETDEGLAFATARGFTQGRSAVHSLVDPATVDVSRLDTLPPDVRVAPLSELESRLEDVFAVVREAVLDEPTSVPVDAFTFDQFLDELRNPLSSWAGTFCTLERDEVATFAGVAADPASGVARNGFTGTRRAYRGRSYATFAKLASIRWLAANGYTKLWTGNDEANAVMLAVNRRLGYRRCSGRSRSRGSSDASVEHVSLGPLSVSRVGLGCNNFGGRLDLSRTRAVVDAALDAGVTFLDTADIYGNRSGAAVYGNLGGSERFLGRLLRGRRGPVVLATKFGLDVGDGVEARWPSSCRRGRRWRSGSLTSRSWSWTRPRARPRSPCSRTSTRCSHARWNTTCCRGAASSASASCRITHSRAAS